MRKDFKECVLRGDLPDFAKVVVQSRVCGRSASPAASDNFNSPIGRLIGNAVFLFLFMNLSHAHWKSAATAQIAGASFSAYGQYLVFTFHLFMVLFLLFLLARQVMGFGCWRWLAPSRTSPLLLLRHCAPEFPRSQRHSSRTRVF